jgi:NADPH:quinone reductase-like Zn-dependent oxidoreductase
VENETKDRTQPPAEIRAIAMTSPKGPAEIQTVPLPTLRDDYMLVRVTAVAINPTDWKSAAGAWPSDMDGCRLGCDYAGVVEAVGPKVTKSFRPGDRVAGMAHGCNNEQKEDGTFAEYAMVKGDLQMLIPDYMTDEEAATLGLGITTVVSLCD